MTLPPPEQNLRVSVVVPARDEEDLVVPCLEALANQEDVTPEEYEVLLVLDRCTDATEARALEVAGEYRDLKLRFLTGPGLGAGHARRVGMEAACARLLSLGRPGGLISSTDADTVVAPDWLAAQLSAAGRGARAIGGRIELSGEGAPLPEGVSRWWADQGDRRRQDILADLGDDAEASGRTEHWQFSGASLALTAATYEEIGGLEPRTALEDEYLERVLRQRGVPIERPLSVRVTTSARLSGRARRGLSRDLALVSWAHRNTFDARYFDLEGLLTKKDRSVSVVLPGNGEDPVTAPLLDTLARLREAGLVDEIIPPPLGNEARDTPDLTREYGPTRGLGDRMWRGLRAASGEIVVFLDAGAPDPSRVLGLLGPLLTRPELRLIKGSRWDATKRRDPHSALVARPLLSLYAPELAGFAEPLSADLAADRTLLESIPFPVGEGIRLSLLLDAARTAGVDALAQTRLPWGSAPDAPPEHTERAEHVEHGEAAYAILAAVSSRVLGADGLDEHAPGPLVLPLGDRLESRRVALEERPPLAGLRASVDARP